MSGRASAWRRKRAWWNAHHGGGRYGAVSRCRARVLLLRRVRQHPARLEQPPSQSHLRFRRACARRRCAAARGIGSCLPQRRTMTNAERVLPLFPLEQVVLFPGMSLPLRIFEERYKVMIGACQVTDQLFGVVLIRSGSEVGVPAEPERVGCTARMVRVGRLPDGPMTILTVGEQRFRLMGPARLMPEGYLVGDVE